MTMDYYGYNPYTQYMGGYDYGNTYSPNAGYYDPYGGSGSYGGGGYGNYSPYPAQQNYYNPYSNFGWGMGGGWGQQQSAQPDYNSMFDTAFQKYFGSKTADTGAATGATASSLPADQAPAAPAADAAKPPNQFDTTNVASSNFWNTSNPNLKPWMSQTNKDGSAKFTHDQIQKRLDNRPGATTTLFGGKRVDTNFVPPATST